MGEINDGYGEPLLDVEAIIGSRWVERMVRAILKFDAPYAEDLAQEARLAMWQAATRWTGAGTLEGFLHQQARWKVLSILSGNHRYTGEEKAAHTSQKRGDEARERMRQYLVTFRREHGREPTGDEAGRDLGLHPASARKQMRTLREIAPAQEFEKRSLDALMDALGGDFIEASVVADDLLLAYHYGEIHEAIAELQPVWREYVFLRFWGGCTDAEAIREVGVQVHWTRDIRPVLAEHLHHLAGAA